MIYLELELTTKCSLKCPYCCAETSARTDKYNAHQKLKMFIKAVSSVTKTREIGVRLMGGEPTLYPLINELVAYLNHNKNVVNVDLYTNGLHKLPRGVYNIFTTLHLDYYAQFEKRIDALADNGNPVIVNVIIPKYSDFNKNEDLARILSKLPERFYVHPQPLYKVSDNQSELKKYEHLFNTKRDYFDELVGYRERLNLFFSNRPIICHPTNFRISEDLILRNDCDHVAGEVNLMERFDVSMVKDTQRLCTTKDCYMDNCVYCEML